MRQDRDKIFFRRIGNGDGRLSTGRHIAFIRDRHVALVKIGRENVRRDGRPRDAGASWIAAGLIAEDTLLGVVHQILLQQPAEAGADLSSEAVGYRERDGWRRLR